MIRIFYRCENVREIPMRRDVSDAKKVLQFKVPEPSFEDLEIADLGGSIHDEALDDANLSFEQIADKQTPGWRGRSQKFQRAMRWHCRVAHGKIK